jgi:colanic acid biosynthesis glycosyl transferase WcaI
VDVLAKLLIYAMNYAPEMAGVGRYTGEIGEYFAQRGHTVVVVTSVPHYPGWKVQPPYRGRRYFFEKAEGMRIVRCPLVLRERMGGLWRLAAPLSFAINSAPIAMWQILLHRPDVVLCVEPTLISAPIAILCARAVGAATVLHVQDLEVDACFAVGHLSRRRWVERIAYAFEKWMLRGFDRVVTISGRMADHLTRKGVEPSRIVIVRNWVDLDIIRPIQGASEYRSELGISDHDCVILYSGNIGAKQGLGVVIGAARKLSRRADIKFVIAGEGPAKDQLRARAADLPNVSFLPFQPYDRLSQFLGLADIHILPQTADAADLFLPSKLGGMLASGRRIIVTASEGTELATFLGSLATFTPPEDADALAAAIEVAADGKTVEPGSIFARQRLAEQLSKADGLERFQTILAGLWSAGRDSPMRRGSGESAEPAKTPSR